MILADLVSTYGLVLDRQRTRKLKNVNGTLARVIGSVTFEISYEGAIVEIIALVSTDLEDEIILSWMKLKKLGAINDRFPHPRDFQAIKAIEEAEKRWKTKKSVSFGNRDNEGVHAHGGHREHQAEVDVDQTCGKAPQAS